ncbi:MAG: hypothetical protein ACRDLT_04115 [Solirubrobacteraceae bacterium]
MTRSLPARITTSPRTRALQLLWRASPAHFIAAVAFIVAEGALPVLVLVLMARVVAAIPGAVVGGLSSPAGHRLIADLVEAGTAYAISLLRGPAQDALTAAATARVDALMQRRLVRAVCAPIGITRREDREVLNQLASARGELLSAGDPSGAPMALISRLGDQLTGVLACLVLCVFRWWVGLELLAVWMLVRRPLAAGLRLQAGRVRSAAEPCGAVLVAYAVAAEIGFAAYHRDVSLRTLVIMRSCSHCRRAPTSSALQSQRS